VELSGLRDWTCLGGAVTGDGESFFSRFPGYVTAEHAKHFILARYEAFEADPIGVLDGASYFRASATPDLADRDGLAFVRFPAYHPDLHPVGPYWRQLDSAPGNRYFESIYGLTRRIDATLDQLSLPKMGNYI